jgi:hypothetical protein
MLVVKLDRDLNLIFLFFVLIFVMNQQRNFLVTVGEDEQISPQQSAMCLKVFDLDKMQSEGTSAATTPDCIGILRIFTNQFPEANVFSSFLSFFLFQIFTLFAALSILRLYKQNLYTERWIY